MSIIKFSDYIDYLCLASAMEELTDDEVIIEWSEEEWYKLSITERAELEAEAIDGWAKWQIEEEDLDEFKARNTMQRRATQIKKDRNKFSDRQAKLKAKIDRKKGGKKVKRLKVRKKWQKLNKSKIANAQKVYGGKVKSKFTKKK
tara:strand:- start:409 stop:843 length:435 start_codon:yes stop_codon:yes gene_type:complete